MAFTNIIFQPEVVNIIVFHWIISIVFVPLLTHRAWAVFSGKVWWITNTYYCETVKLYSLLQWKGSYGPRCVCHLIRRDYCGNARVLHMSGARGCCVTAGLDWHILREEKKDERIRMESVKQGQAIYSGFSQYRASDIWYVLQKARRWDFSLRICALIKRMVYLRMKTSWQRKSNPYSFLYWKQKITLG